MNSISVEEIQQYQKLWADSLLEVGRFHQQGKNFEQRAQQMVDSLYDFSSGTVMFKPTKASEVPFRETRAKALSYFTGQNGACQEDRGFALSGWTDVKFENHQVVTEGPLAWAMGEYFFTDPKGEVTRVEYTFGYKMGEDQKLRIFLHHSSLPYQGEACSH